MSLWLGLRPVAAAATLQLSTTDDSYTVLNGNLADALRQFGDDVHLRVNVSEDVKGRIRGRVSAASPRAFLDLVTSIYGLEWYYDGYTLYITTNGEGVTRLIDVPAEESVSLQKALDAGGVTDMRFPLRVLPGANRIMVSGPPHYVDLVTQTASALTTHPASPTREVSAPDDTVTVYRGTSGQKLSFPH